MKLAIGFVLVILSAQCWPDEGPALRPGLWDLRQTINGRPYNTRKCTRPYADLLAQQRELAGSGCSFSVTRKSETHYEIQSRCQKTNEQGRRWESDALHVLTVSNETAYQLEVTGTTHKVPLRESTQGRWVGPCSE